MEKISRYENVGTRNEGTTLIIEIEMDEEKVDVQPSASGKTWVVATTGGALRIGQLHLNLTLYHK